MDYKELKLYDFDVMMKNSDHPAEKEALMKEFWREDDRQFVNWIVGLLM